MERSVSLLPFLLMLAGRAIWCRLQPKQTGEVFDWAWIALGTGLIALFLSFGRAGQDAEDREHGDDARVPSVRVDI